MIRLDHKQSPTHRWIQDIRRRLPTDPTMDSLLTQKLLRRADGPYSAIDAREVHRRLNNFLKQKIADEFEISELRRLPGGASKEQFVFDLVRRSTEGRRSERLVLRLEPAESLVETSRLCEFQVMRALEGTVPVPSARWVDPQGSALGQPGLIASFVRGVTRPAITQATNVSGVGILFGPLWRERLKRPFVENLVRIHRFDWRMADLGGFNIPETASTACIESILNWHDRVWEEDSIQEIPLIPAVSRWLRENMPVLDRISLLHGDYRQGNFMFDEGTGEITAILDWELSHLGDYHEDLGYMCQPPTTGCQDENGNILVCGLFSRSEFLELYEEVAQVKVDHQRVRYFEIMHLRKSVITCLGTALRIVQGAKTHQDVLNAWLAPIGYSCLHHLANLMDRELAP